MSTNMMNIRDNGVYWYLGLLSHMHPWTRRIPFLVNSSVTDITSTMITWSPLLFLTSRVNGWTLNINENKPRRVRSSFIKHFTPKTIYKIQTITIVLSKQHINYNFLYIIPNTKILQLINQNAHYNVPEYKWNQTKASEKSAFHNIY